MTDRPPAESPERYAERLRGDRFLRGFLRAFSFGHDLFGPSVDRLLRERGLFEAGLLEPPDGGAVATLVVVGDAPADALDRTLRLWSLQSCPHVRAVVVRPGGEGGIGEVDWDGLAADRFVLFALPGDLPHPSLAASLARIARSNDPDVVVWNGLRVLARRGIRRRYAYLHAPAFDPETALHVPYAGRRVAVRPGIARRYPFDALRAAAGGDGHLFQAWLATPGDLRWTAEPEYLSLEIPGLTPPEAGDPAGESVERFRRIVAPLDERFEFVRGDGDDPPFRLRPRTRAGRISVVVPFRDLPEMTVAAVGSIARQEASAEVEAVLVDNDSLPENLETVRDGVARLGLRVRIVPCPGPFNHSRECMVGVEASRGEVVVFMNNDVVLRSPGLLQEAADWALVPGIGTVGCRLTAPAGRLLTAGVQASRYHKSKTGLPIRGSTEGRFSLHVRRTFANTFALAALRRSILDEVGPLAAVDFPCGFNDVEYCLRISRAGYRHLYLGHLQAVHALSTSRGRSDETAEQTLLLSRFPEIHASALFGLETGEIVHRPAPGAAGRISSRLRRLIGRR